MLNPDIFLMQEDASLLVQAFNTLGLALKTADDRQNVLINAGIHLTFRSKLNLDVSPQIFANKLVANCRDYHTSMYHTGYHPMISLLEYLLQVYELEDRDKSLFTRLVKQGRNNFKALAARSAVGRIESPLGTSIGTGVLVDKQHLLTCHHVFERIFEQGQKLAWVRFGYKVGQYGAEAGELFKLDIEDFVHCATPSEQAFDYELVRIIDRPELQPATLSHDIPCPTQHVRLIHHPRGEPVQISNCGQIVLVDPQFIQHNVETDYGSSGAPIFDLDWNVIGLHRGTLRLSRPSPSGVTEGVSISSIWNDIEPHLRLPIT
jgi:Effector-associated domain 8/Trypsin-like peptidase domain